MNRITLRLSFSCLLLVASSACSGSSSQNAAPVNTSNAPVAAKPSPSASKSPLEGMVSVSAEPLEIGAGERAEVRVKLSIADGFHVNANPATEALLIPTAIEVAPETGVTVEKTLYPKAVLRKFSFSAQPLAVYEGEADIELTVRVARDVTSGARALRARVRVQPCDHDKCYPPGTLETSLPITVR